jgi:hypothetical protein
MISTAECIFENKYQFNFVYKTADIFQLIQATLFRLFSLIVIIWLIKDKKDFDKEFHISMYDFFQFDVIFYDKLK